MLLSLNVKNFAIIDNISIDFHDGMTVLTGETGAGKSLIIDAIGLLFGKRASNDMIRYGESKATIEGFFSIYNDEIKKLLSDLTIDFSDEDNLIIKRELYSNGKSVCRINNTVVTLSQLSEVSDQIGDIHSQIDTFGLINPKNYLQFLSNVKISELLKDYTESLKEYRNIAKQYEDLLIQDQENKTKEEFWRYQLQEYEIAKININEEEELKNELSYLSNFENLTESISEINEIIDNENVMDNLYLILSLLEKLEQYDSKYSSLKNVVNDAYYSLEEVVNHHDLKLTNLDFDPNHLEEVNLRLSIYSDFKRKYKMQTNEIIKYFESIKQNLNFIENADEYLHELKVKVDKSFINTLKIAKDIRNERINISKGLVEDTKKHLYDLQLRNTVFEITFNEIDESNINFKKDGIDEIDFLISFNKGEPVKPLSKTASGGEMSRFMLALKTVLGSSLQLQTKIFDEIDNGVSGSVAYSIAEKIKYISDRNKRSISMQIEYLVEECIRNFEEENGNIKIKEN